MKVLKIGIISDEPHHIQILADLIRSNFPGIKIEKAFLDDLTKKTKDQGLFLITPLSEDTGFKITFLINEQEYVEIITWPISSFFEDEKNKVRRLLRLGVKNVISRFFTKKPQYGRTSPWGILTGVRPTKIVHRFLAQGFSPKEVEEFLIRDFGLAVEKAQLLCAITQYQQEYLLKPQEALKTYSVYMSIPFCPTRCTYCSFPAFSLKQMGHLLDDYLQGLLGETIEIGAILKKLGVMIDTFYLGGGTPTILTAKELDVLLTKTRQALPFSELKEFTVEGGRPDTLSSEKLEVLLAHGVNRLSINPQTFREETLKVIGRKHTLEDILTMYHLARGMGFKVLNMDLIIGLPGENLAILQNTLEKIMELRPENITLHAFAVKRAALYRQQKQNLPDEKEGQEMMNLAHSLLKAAGYIPYYLYRQKEIFAQGENVGYCLAGLPCVYNIRMIEERQTILGLGVGSGSKFVNIKDWSLENIYNPKDIHYYLQRLPEIIERKVDKLKSIVIQ